MVRDPRVFHDRNRRIVRDVARAGALMLLVLAGLEVLLRTCMYSPGITYVVDAELGKVPGAGTVVVWGTEGHGVTHYVANGEIATPYSDGASVVVLGDSHTEAFQVDDNQKFVSIAEQLLRQRGLKMDLHNLGASGATLADYAYIAPFVHRRYDPTLVVVQIEQSDFGDEGFDQRRVNHFILQNNALQLVHIPLLDSGPTAGRWLRRSLALVNYGYFRYEQIHTRQASSDARGEHSIDAHSARPDQTPGIASLELQALRDAYAGVPVIVLVLPEVPKISNHQIVREDRDYVALVQTVLGVANWSVLDPANGFRDLAAQGRLPRGFANTLPGEGHLNTNGHAVVGASLAARIESMTR